MNAPDAGMDPQRLLAELRVHQAELEAQNEELRLARDAAQRALVDYTDLYELAPVGYATLREDATIVESNHQLARLLGVDRLSLRGRSLMKWLAEPDRMRLLPILTRANGGGPTPAADFDLITADGCHRTVAVTATRVAASGAVRMAFTDQTELRAAERAAQQFARMESVSRLAGGIAHDLNNLLTVVSVHDDFLLETTPADSPIREDLEAIHGALQQAASLTSRLMAFARPQVLAGQRVEVQRVIENFLPLLRRLIPERVVVETSLAAGEIVVDPAQLEQVLTHLSVNAAEAMPQGGTLRLETAVVTLNAEGLQGQPGIASGSYVRISAIDTGVGIDEAALAHLFEPYFTTKARGSGLGLATVYAVVRQAGGFVQAESELGVGTRVHLYFPEADIDEPISAKPPRSERTGGHETVLVVEDDPAIRTVVSRMLTRIGYQVHVATDGHDAFAQLLGLGFKVDLILSDVVMPSMTGPELVARVREHRPAMRVVFMTGYASAEEMAEEHVPANLGVLHKPFSLESLQRTVRDALDAP